MKRITVVSFCLGLICLAPNAMGQETKKGSEINSAEIACSEPSSALSAASVAVTTKYVVVDKYDPARNADQDIQNALAEAKRTNKRVLLEVGGLWCKWCHYMDAFFENQPEVLALREKNFVTLKVNFSDENKNEVVLSRFPKIVGFPHIFVLDTDGKMIHSQDTGELEKGKGYDSEKFSTFLKQWAPTYAGIARH